VNHHSLAASYY